MTYVVTDASIKCKYTDGVVLLGLGPDGHTASIFPGTDVINEKSSLVAAPWVEKLKSYRITLPPPVLNNAASVIRGLDIGLELSFRFEDPVSESPSRTRPQSEPHLCKRRPRCEGGCVKSHRTKVFFLLQDGAVRHLDQSLYAQVARGEIVIPEFASRCMRLADLYVLYDGEMPISIDNETYVILWFDGTGLARPHSDATCKPRNWSPWTPTAAERDQLRQMIFGKPGAVT